MSDYTPVEMMNIAAARELHDGTVCLVGVGPPSLAANTARRTHAPGLVLVYESGTIDAKPRSLPLSIGDGDLAETATSVVSLPEMFNYWIQGGRIDVGFLGAAQIDRCGNINTTAIGEYDKPKVRLPGAGGAPEIAAAAGRVIVMVRQAPRAFVEEIDFKTSLGPPAMVITDLGVLEPDRDSRELIMTRLHEGVSAEQAREATGWDLKVADDPQRSKPPTAAELEALRELQATRARVKKEVPA